MLIFINYFVYWGVNGFIGVGAIQKHIAPHLTPSVIKD